MHERKFRMQIEWNLLGSFGHTVCKTFAQGEEYFVDFNVFHGENRSYFNYLQNFE